MWFVKMENNQIWNTHAGVRGREHLKGSNQILTLWRCLMQVFSSCHLRSPSDGMIINVLDVEMLFH